MYLWQTDLLQAGKLAVPDGGHPKLFHPWLSAATGGELFPQYTPGWPLVLLVGRFLGSTELAVGFGAALAVGATWLFARELTGDRRVATVSASLLLLSPIVVLQGGVHLNYLFSLGLGLLFLTGTFAGARTGRRGLLVAAGFALGWVAFTRPFDAVVWAALGGGYLLVEHGAPWRAQLRRALLVGLGAAGPVLALLLTNNRLTGSPLEFPITVADPLDTFGFGDRRLMPGFDKVPYGKRLAIESTARNAFWLPFFLVGAHLGAALGLLAAWWHRREHRVWLLVALGLGFPIFYFPFFGTQISSIASRLTGPIYFIPAYVPLCILLAMALLDLRTRSPKVALGALVAGLLVTVPLLVDRATLNRDLSLANEPWADSLDTIDGDALVVISPQPYLMFANPYSDNGATYDGRILFASDAGADLVDLVLEHRERTPYLQQPDLAPDDLLPSEHPQTPEVVLTPIEVVQGPEVELATALGTATATQLEVDGSLVSDPVRGSTTWTLRPADLAPGLHTVDVIANDAAGRYYRHRFYLARRGGRDHAPRPRHGGDLRSSGGRGRLRRVDPDLRRELRLHGLSRRLIVGVAAPRARRRPRATPGDPTEERLVEDPAGGDRHHRHAGGDPRDRTDERTGEHSHHGDDGGQRRGDVEGHDAHDDGGGTGGAERKRPRRGRGSGEGRLVDGRGPDRRQVAGEHEQEEADGDRRAEITIPSHTCSWGTQSTDAARVPAPAGVTSQPLA